MLPLSRSRAVHAYLSVTDTDEKKYLANNGGTIVRPQGRPNVNFSVVPDAILLDTSISTRARLVLSYIAGRPDGWVATVTDIRKKLGLTESQWKTTRDELRRTGIVPPDQPKRVGGGVNKFTWVLDLHMERYYLSTPHPPKIADGSHQRFSMDGKVADYQKEFTNTKKPPPTPPKPPKESEVVVYVDQEEKRALLQIEGFTQAELARVHVELAKASVEQIELFGRIWRDRRAKAADEVAMAVGLAQRASKGELREARTQQLQAGGGGEAAAEACARHARGPGQLLGPDGLLAIARAGYGGLFHSPTGGLFPAAVSQRLWQKLETGALEFQPAR